MTAVLTRRSTKISRLAVAAALVVICGCGGGVGTLTGKVTYKGKTVASGNVIVIGKDGIARYGKIETDGSYTIADVPVGEAQVGVNSPDPRPDPEKLKVSTPGAKRGGRTQQDPISTTPTSDPALWFPLPEQYADATKSGITVKVEKGQTPKNIELQ
jgi:hypothetical protein